MREWMEAAIDGLTCGYCGVRIPKGTVHCVLTPPPLNRHEDAAQWRKVRCEEHAGESRPNIIEAREPEPMASAALLARTLQFRPVGIRRDPKMAAAGDVE